MKKALTAFLVGLLVSGFGAMPVFAGSPGSGASIKRRVKKASSGHPFPLEQFGTKVFEIKDTSQPTLVVDEDGTAPTTGTLHMICGSIGTLPTPWTESFIVFDASATLNSPAITMDTVGRALHPPMQRASEQTVCSPRIDTQFHWGLVAKNSLYTGSTYIYWSANGRGNN